MRGELYELTNINQESGVELTFVSEKEYGYGADAFEVFQKNYAYKSDTLLHNENDSTDGNKSRRA